MGKRVKKSATTAARRLKRLRLESNQSQTEFARRLGISVWTIRNWEQGRTVPDNACARFVHLWLDARKLCG